MDLDVFDGLTDEQNIIYVIRLVFADKNERNAFLERTIIIIGIDKFSPPVPRSMRLGSP